MKPAVQLSPLTLRRVIDNIKVGAIESGATVLCRPSTRLLRKQPREIVRWECPECMASYDDEDDAAECCADTVTYPSDAGLERPKCPVCGERHVDYHSAASCCLWKDIDATTRARIADAVEAGSTWAAELKVNEFGRVEC